MLFVFYCLIHVASDIVCIVGYCLLVIF